MLPFDFQVLEPEDPDSHAEQPQILVLSQSMDVLQVWVYFMLNQALEITGGHVTHGMGKIKLWCTAETPSGAYTASTNLRKVLYTFSEAQGLSRDFSFAGVWPPERAS